MKVQITSGMLTALIINMLYAKAIGVSQGIMAREIGADIWLATLFATLQGGMVMFLTVWVTRKTPDKDIVEFASLLLGSWGGKMLSTVLLLFFLGAYGTVMITFVYHMKDYFVPEAPTFVFVAAATAISLYGSNLGLEVMGRMALAGIFGILVLNILLLIGSIQDFDIREILPVFKTGLAAPLWSSRHNDTDWAMATLMCAFILPMVNRKEKRARVGMTGIALGGLFVIMWPIMEVGVLSPEVTKQYIVACMQMARSAHIGHFIQRYEMFMIGFFSISALIQCMACLFCGSLAASKIVGIKDYRPILLPVGAMMAGFGYWVVRDHHRAMMLLSDYWPSISLVIAVGVPLVLLLLSYLLRSKLKYGLQDKGASGS